MKNTMHVNPTDHMQNHFPCHLGIRATVGPMGMLITGQNDPEKVLSQLSLS